MCEVVVRERGDEALIVRSGGSRRSFDCAAIVEMDVEGRNAGASGQASLQCGPHLRDFAGSIMLL
jgi:hypothetical protein